MNERSFPGTRGIKTFIQQPCKTQQKKLSIRRITLHEKKTRFTTYEKVPIVYRYNWGLKVLSGKSEWGPVCRSENRGIGERTRDVKFQGLERMRTEETACTSGFRFQSKGSKRK